VREPFYHSLSAIVATLLWWRLCLLSLGVLDEVEVFIVQLVGNMKAGWGVAMTMRILGACARQIWSVALALLISSHS